MTAITRREFGVLALGALALPRFAVAQNPRSLRYLDCRDDAPADPGRDSRAIL